ncbi:MAG: ATP-binding cassette domain-containing protein [Dehalococcoidia bacterium]|nr:ATP-binding cassette domain-containing protein [Dehalococcoidia bacterium]
MATAVNFAGVSLSFAARPVLRDVSWEINDGMKVGLVGPNGAGKSTLFRLLMGAEEPDSGSIYRRPGASVGYLAQEPVLTSGCTVLEECLAADERVGAAEARMRDLETQMGLPEVYEDGERLAQVMEAHQAALDAWEHLDGGGYAGRVERTLRRLGFAPEEFTLPVEALSGGQRKLLALAKVLVAQPAILLLDEPDNHLDLDGKALLERVILDHPGTVVIISHDRYLLDVVADEITEVETTGLHPGRPQLTVWPGNYSEYVVDKRGALEQQQKDHVLQEREATRLEQSIQRLKVFSRGGANEKFVRRWKSMQKRLDKMDRVERPVLDRRRMGLELSAERGSRKVLEVTGLERRFDDIEVLSGLELLIWSGERVGLVGPNGAGKSVLFQLLLGEDEPDGGAIKLGPSIEVGYYAQQHETLDPGRSALEEVRRLRQMHEGDAVAFLGRFLFDYELARRPIRTLSGGEKSRLQMAKLMLTQANLLLLDEPTNNLDIPSCEVLEDALEDYRGTVLAISHDRYFLERIATRIVELRDGRLVEHASYAGYRERLEARGAVVAPA